MQFLKRALRKAMRWYVEPLAQQQRSFNDATLKLIDALFEELDRISADRDTRGRLIAELEERVLRLERRPAAPPRRSRRSRRRRPSPTTSPSRAACAARPSSCASASVRTSTTCATTRPCSTSAAAAASSSRCSATPGWKRVGSTRTGTWSPTPAAKGSTSSRPTCSPTSSRSRTEALGAIFAGQVVEHLPPPALVRFLELARAKLRDGGVLIAETINPLSPFALRNYFADLTHAQPLVPETLAQLVRHAGFREVETRYLHEPEPRRRRRGAVADVLFAPLDYAIHARR